MTGQLTADDLKGMTPEAIDAAHEQGRFDVLLGRQTSGAAGDGQVTAEQLAAMTPEQIVEAQDAGRLDVLLGRKGPA